MGGTPSRKAPTRSAEEPPGPDASSRHNKNAALAPRSLQTNTSLNKPKPPPRTPKGTPMPLKPLPPILPDAQVECWSLEDIEKAPSPKQTTSTAKLKSPSHAALRGILAGNSSKTGSFHDTKNLKELARLNKRNKVSSFRVGDLQNQSAYCDAHNTQADMKQKAESKSSGETRNPAIAEGAEELPIPKTKVPARGPAISDMYSPSKAAVTFDNKSPCKRKSPAKARFKTLKLQVDAEAPVIPVGRHTPANGTLSHQASDLEETQQATYNPQAKEESKHQFDYKKTSGADIMKKNQYLFVEHLGQGTSGTVHKALHLPSMRLVAVKVIQVYDQQKRQQMMRELQVSFMLTNRSSSPLRKVLAKNKADLRRPSGVSTKFSASTASTKQIVALYDTFMDTDRGFLVMEYMDGGSLQDITDQGGCASEKVLASIAEQVLRALLTLYQNNQVHRDVKPANLLINHKGEVKLADFGVTREIKTEGVAKTFIGTVSYMSPERITAGKYSYSSDIWSLGLSLMTLALGQFPYKSSLVSYFDLLDTIVQEAVPPLQNRDGQPWSKDFQEFIAAAMEKDPQKRATAQGLLNHPFIVKNNDGQGSMSPSTAKIAQGMWGEDVEQEELDLIVAQLAAHLEKEQGEQGVLQLWQGPLKLHHIIGLAVQLGLSQQSVMDKFAQELSPTILNFPKIVR